jgi:MYXO-CTERM domain-containing protein
MLAIGAVRSAAAAEDLFVGGAGDPHATIADALEAAADGDVVVVRAGTYGESLATQRPGVTLRGEGEVVIESPSRVLRVSHARFTAEDVVLDGMEGASDAVVIDDDAEGAVLRRVTVRNSGRDCIDIRGPSGVRIEQSLVHHCLWSSRAGCDAADCREDAHGIVAGPVRDLRITDTEVHSFSGDAFQVDPGRSEPSWSDVTIERCTFWLEPLPAAAGGFAAGVVPGENAVDTKTPPAVVEPARLTIVDTVARGFGGGLIGNMAAFNLKENVQALLDRVTVHGSEIAFRLRGATASAPRGALVTIYNAVVFDVEKAVRYEDDIAPVVLWNTTFGSGVAEAFDDQSSGSTIDARNLLVLGASLPAEAMGATSNLAVPATAFVDASAHDYHLADGSPAVDAGEMLAEVTVDRDRVPRPAGTAWDVGAFELCTWVCDPPDAGSPGRDAGGPATRDGGGPATGDAGRRADAAAESPEDSGGCGCRVSPRTRPRAALLGAVGLLLLAARRKRRP